MACSDIGAGGAHGGRRRAVSDISVVMDHVWQITVMGPETDDMLEAYTTLGFLAAHTSRVPPGPRRATAWSTANRACWRSR